MMWILSRTRGLGAMCDGLAVVLGIGLIAGCPLAATASESCAAPPLWREAAARPGRPGMEFAACIRDQGYETRSLAVLLESTAQGIIAQCHVRVDYFEGKGMAERETAPEQARQAADREDFRQAVTAVTHYRRCVGR